MINDSFEVLQQPRIKSRIEDIKAMSDEVRRLALIKQLFREIQGASGSIVNKMEEGTVVNNLDEVTTSFHNELKQNTNKLLAALKDLKLSGEEQNEISMAIQKDALGSLQDEFQTIRIKKNRDRVEVMNLDDLVFPSEMKINNMEELKTYFDSLEKKIEESFKIDIPSPQVNVEAPVINVPQQEISIPEVDFDPIIEELKRGLLKLRTNNKSNPMFVRMTDFEKMIEVLEEVREASKNVMLGFPGSIGIRGISGGLADPDTFGSGGSLLASSVGDGSQTVTTSGTRVQLSVSSVPCKWVIVVGKVANAGTIYLGGVTVAVGRGRPLVPLQSERLDIKNLNQVYIDGDTNSDGVTFCYGS